MATTPPPPSTLRIPPTPRLGSQYDEYEPYSTRHSARLASQRASRESRTTPPPSFPSTKGTAKHNSHSHEAETLSPPGSVQGSPRKHRSARTVGLFASHSLDGASLDDSDPFGAEPSYTRRPPQSLRPTMTEGMLPTPAKTPRKKAVGDVGGTARALFPAPPSSRKRTKKHTGFSLDSFSEDNARGGSEIQIYTDSRDRIPEVDNSESNPFYKKPAAGNSTVTRTSRRRESRRDKDIDESIDREDGMVYVFRGKKMFRKFTDDVPSDNEDDDDDLGLLAARPDLIDSSITASIRPLTRSSIKPRVLFPSTKDQTPETTQLSDVDEEAATDIEDQALHADTEPEADEHDEHDDHAVDIEMQQRPVTPPPPTTATPASPGATMRSLRSRSKREGPDHGDTPTVSETKKKRVSPFDGWLRKKQTPAVTGTKAKKRDAEAAGSPGGPATKKTRGNKATVSS
ncbi:hypothetical protein BO70DRAFT_13228 [Aspergillus heteromorphus CBS 117.55]|uniref:Uncharacterized protein n=1 Tax=Aspergillus heteromorphus CBS 117.55 TaxID=1448321 RepID=A0A317X7F8_9EURO|nr:uncharacterized protein BO70DRAFT_13228 [Aspergillus heteromorphus CBS 117.55]PWY92530.1 hypothetical protein BO70DRAFT_13228 [Aspergillus heteromorphus CBS 117.55]